MILLALLTDNDRLRLKMISICVTSWAQLVILYVYYNEREASEFLDYPTECADLVEITSKYPNQIDKTENEKCWQYNLI